jgi:hypothetical protein
MRPYRTRFREQGVFFGLQSWAGCIINMFGFDLRQAQVQNIRQVTSPQEVVSHIRNANQLINQLRQRGILIGGRMAAG